MREGYGACRETDSTIVLDYSPPSWPANAEPGIMALGRLPDVAKIWEFPTADEMGPQLKLGCGKVRPGRTLTVASASDRAICKVKSGLSQLRTNPDRGC
jgi:hypothetical protein